MANIVYRQMPAPRELPPTNPRPLEKAWMQSPRVGANFWCKSPGVRGDEIDTCITVSSRGYMWEIFTRTGDTTFLSDVAGIVKPECCRLCNKIAGTVLQNIHRTELFATCCRYWGHLATLSQNRLEDVKLAVRVENRRCSHGLM